MATKQISTTFRTSPEGKDYLDKCFEGSGASSKGEFYIMLADRYNEQPATEIREVEKIVEVERNHAQNELSVHLSPAAMFALKNTILSTANFAQDQNAVIDSLKIGNRPFLYFGSLFEPEFQSIWIKNKVITKEMTGEEKEAVIKFNMSAFLMNMFFTNLIEGRISETLVTAETLKSFIRKQISDSKPKPLPVDIN